MNCKIHTDLKRRYKSLGLTTRELGMVLNEQPTTVCARLNGFSPLTPEQRIKLTKYMDEIELQQKTTEEK